MTVSVLGEGTVAEKVVSTRADYSSGTVVELTADPSSGWRFSRWEGDLQGDANPSEIEVTSPKTVSAVFEKQNYSFNVRIVGPGVVDEFLSEDTKATLAYGTKVRLVAVPSEGAVFKGWSGGIESGEAEIEYSVSSSEDIIATFSYDKTVRRYDLPDLYQPSSYRKQMYYGIDFEHFTSQLTGYSAQDYDRDGYVDIITCISNYSYERNNFCFYRGMPDGSFKKDEVNSGKLFAPCSNRKSVYGDFNGDGLWECPTYCGWSIQMVKYSGGEFVDVTGRYINDEDNSEMTGPAMVYIDFEEIDDELYLTGRRYPNTEKLFAAGRGRFVKVEENKTPERIVRNNGFVLYSDSEGTSGVCVETQCGESPYSGNACIKFQNWKIWQGCEFVFNEGLQNGLDISKLYDDDYALEFYIKNSDPTLEIHFTFQSILDYDSWTVVDYGKDIRFDGELSSGEWTRVICPLKNFSCGPEWSSENYWKKLDRLTFWTASDGRNDFYLDEIRIRKIL